MEIEFKKEVEEYFDKNYYLWIENNRSSIRQQYLELLGEVTNKKILDVGCGLGIDANILSKRGASGKGLDLSGKSVDYAQKQNIHNWEFQKGDSEAVYNGKFDGLISSMEIMYHKNLKKTMSNYAKQCKIKARFLLVTNNPYLIAYTYNLDYRKEEIYCHNFKKTFPKTRKYHRSINELIQWANNAKFKLCLLKEIHCENEDSRSFEQKNQYHFPDFLALLFIKE